LFEKNAGLRNDSGVGIFIQLLNDGAGGLAQVHPPWGKTVEQFGQHHFAGDQLDSTKGGRNLFGYGVEFVTRMQKGYPVSGVCEDSFHS